jgi:lipopolysaccharide/colanic/teichoic acid biosynthesis glycosyltransferase
MATHDHAVRGSASKRALDLIVGALLAVVLTPVMLLLAVGSAVSYRRWPLFVHERIGRDGDTFQFVKIRSLPPTAPHDANKYEIGRLKNNRWGRFLRRFHIDELPQLWLVVFGKMSLVGPRPEMPRLAATFDEEFVRERSLVRPGCTGLWQISRDSAGLIGEAPEYDLHYVRNWTFRLDIWILLKTLVEVAGGRSLESLHELPDWTGAPAPVPVELAA